MFEVIEDQNKPKTAPASVMEHVQAVFTEAKRLKIKMAELKEQAKQERVNAVATHTGENLKFPYSDAERTRRVQHTKERNLQDFEVKGLADVKAAYKQSMDTLNVNGVEESELCLSAIQQQKVEIENRLFDLSQRKKTLKAKLTEYELIETTLNSQSVGYIETLARGDVEAAEALDNKRMGELRENTSGKQDTAYKLSATQQAETLLKNDISIYTEMEHEAGKNVLSQQYHALMVRFNEVFTIMETEFIALDDIAEKLWGKNSNNCEYRAKIKELMD